MLIGTRAIGFPLTEALLRYVEARMESALGAFSRQVFKVTVRLEDVNSDRGGIDKRCQVVVALRGHRTLVAEALDTDLYAAIDEAARRIRRSVADVFRREQTLARHEPQWADLAAAR